MNPGPQIVLLKLKIEKKLNKQINQAAERRHRLNRSRRRKINYNVDELAGLSREDETLAGLRCNVSLNLQNTYFLTEFFQSMVSFSFFITMQ